MVARQRTNIDDAAQFRKRARSRQLPVEVDGQHFFDFVWSAIEFGKKNWCQKTSDLTGRLSSTPFFS
jgi:hypothetical protein